MNINIHFECVTRNERRFDIILCCSKTIFPIVCTIGNECSIEIIKNMPIAIIKICTSEGNQLFFPAAITVYFSAICCPRTPFLNVSIGTDNLI